MKWPLVIMVAAGLCHALVGAAGSDNKTDLEKMQGDWKVILVEAGGKKQDKFADRIVIKKNRVTFHSNGKPMSVFNDLEMKLDATKTPKTMDLVRKGMDPLPLIYEITDDEFKLVVPFMRKDQPTPRPESFDSTAKPPTIVVTAKRSTK